MIADLQNIFSRVEVDTQFLGLFGKLVNLDGSGPGDTSQATGWSDSTA